jgi:hypothetical protein
MARRYFIANLRLDSSQRQLLGNIIVDVDPAEWSGLGFTTQNPMQS